jgi:AcrR family transcriptional regulator
MASKQNLTRRQKLEEREQSIVAAAHDEFIEHGFEGAKIAGIARRAGVAEGTLYLYFRNKKALLDAVAADFYERLTRGAARGVEQLESAIEKVAFLARHHLGSCLAEWSILELVAPVFWLSREYAESDLHRFNRTYVAVFDGVIKEGMLRGEIRDDLPLQLLRDMFFGTLEHTVRTSIVRRKVLQAADIDATIDQFMALTGAAIASPGDRATPAPASGLRTVAERLEAAVERLEQASPKPHRSQS